MHQCQSLKGIDWHGQGGDERGLVPRLARDERSPKQQPVLAKQGQVP